MILTWRLSRVKTEKETKIERDYDDNDDDDDDDDDDSVQRHF